MAIHRQPIGPAWKREKRSNEQVLPLQLTRLAKVCYARAFAGIMGHSTHQEGHVAAVVRRRACEHALCAPPAERCGVSGATDAPEHPAELRRVYVGSSIASV